MIAVPNEHEMDFISNYEPTENANSSTLEKVYIKIHKFGTSFKIFLFLMYYVIGVLFFVRYEKWDIIQCVYFITVTATTTGYGYFHPSSDSSKLFDVFFMLFGVSVILTFANEFARTVLLAAQDEFIQFFHAKILRSNKLSVKALKQGRSVMSILLLVLFGVIGTLFYSGNEGWSFIDGLYWTVCTMTTVGYGDLTIKKDSTRIFAIFFIFSCVLIYAVTYNNIVDEWVERITDAEHRLKLQQLPDNKFDSKWAQRTVKKRGSDDQTCNKDRFVLSVLTEMGVIGFEGEIKPLYKLFNLIDVDRKGVLTVEELLKFRSHVEKLSLAVGEPEFAVNPLHDVESLYAAVSQPKDSIDLY